MNERNKKRTVAPKKLCVVVDGTLNHKHLTTELARIGITAVHVSSDDSSTTEMLLARIQTLNPLFVVRGSAMGTILAERISRSLNIPVYDSQLHRLEGNELSALPSNESTNEWNRTERPFSEHLCIHQLIEAQVQKTPNQVAAIFENQAMTYRELNEHANRLANYLTKIGVTSETVVGIYMKGRSLELLISMIAILKAGGAYTPLDAASPRDRLEYQTADSGAKFMLAIEEGQEPYRPNGLKLIPFPRLKHGNLWANENSENPILPIHSSQLAYVLYTSGSTGTPKGVEICHSGVVNFLEHFVEILDVTKSDVVAWATGLTFDIAALEVFLTLICGAKLAVIPTEQARTGEGVRTALEALGVTLLQMGPTRWRLLFNTGWSAPPGFKMACGGEAMPQPLLEDFMRQNARCWNLYGPTETTIWSTAREMSRDEFMQGSLLITVGRPIANTEIHILDENRVPVAIGMIGEVCIGGVGLARGYRNRPELTRERFIQGPFKFTRLTRLYRTGDLGRFTDSGEIELVGRSDYQIKINGIRIEPGEIESAVRSVTGAKEIVVMFADEKNGNRLVAYVVGPQRDESELKSALQHKLPKYMIPSYFVFLRSFPLNLNGKLDRSALPLVTTKAA